MRPTSTCERVRRLRRKAFFLEAASPDNRRSKSKDCPVSIQL